MKLKGSCRFLAPLFLILLVIQTPWGDPVRSEGQEQDVGSARWDRYSDPDFPLEREESRRMPHGAPALLSHTADIIAYMQANTDGVVGIYLKEIGGPVLQAFNENTIFEPASTIKATVHLHGMLAVQNGPPQLNDPINWLADMTKFDMNNNYVCGGADCYADNTVMMASDRDDSHRLMLECSDNANTQALRDVYGDPNIRDTMYNVVGMSMSSQLNHSIGCGNDAIATPNQLTLSDIGLLYEMASTGLLDDFHLGVFYDLLPNGEGFFDTPVDEEAAIRLLTGSEISDFKDQVMTAWKPGGYTLIINNQQLEYRSRAGWAKIPFACEGTDTEYVFGHFVDAATDLDLQDNGQGISLGVVAGEQFRDIIGLALDSVVCDRPPSVDAPSELMMECSIEGGVPKDDPAVQAWLSLGSASDQCDGDLPVGTSFLPNLLPAGCSPGQPSSVDFSAIDSCGNETVENSSIVVLDSTPPEINCGVTVDTLWPPNHGFVNVGFFSNATDVCNPDTVATQISVTSDEATSEELGSGGPFDCPDAIVGTDGSVQLRAERSGNGDGRVYRITATATDSCGNASLCTVQVKVPKSQGEHGAAVDSGQNFQATKCN
jgi:hypothetical protein